MTTTSNAPGQGRRRRSTQAGRTQTVNTRPVAQSSSSMNAILVWFFAMGLFVASLGINVFNVFQTFAPATNARFIASGVIDFILLLPGFTLLAVLFRIAVGALLVVSLQQKTHRRWQEWITSPVWLIYLFILGYCLFTGLSNVVMTIPFLVALMIVALLQFVEILFWTVPNRHPVLWVATAVAYAIESGLQYHMLPFHPSYDTALGLLAAMGSPSFDWAALDMVQVVIAVIALLGVELGGSLVRIVHRYV